MNNVKKFLIGAAAGATIFINAVMPVSAAYTLFGESSIVMGGNPGEAIQTVSDANPGYGGASFDDVNGTFISGLTTLSTDYNVTDDNCGAGAPRFSITVDADNDNVASAGDKSVFVYLGAHPNYNTCTPNTWVASGNLVTAANPIWDTSQVGGTFYDTFANASTLTSTYEILGISLVTDSGWNATAAVNGDGEQTVLFDNSNINGTTYNFTPVQSTVTVTIDKYIDGSKATATTANNSAFPMSATWNATNIGAGSGNYDLDADGFNGNPTPYQAITSEMTTGADYTTSEVTGGSVVGASCTTGQPYALVGYTSGNTLSDAQEGTPSPTVPNFTNLDSNKYVIVWNMTCPVTTPTPNPYAIPTECSEIAGLGAPIVGTNGSNVINGTSGNDLIFALGGSDVVNGKAGDDCIVAGNGSDVVIGGAGHDVILGGDGSDSISGDQGNDKIYGAGGSDDLNGGVDNDQIWGGAGSDSLKGGAGTDTLIGDGGSDAANGNAGTDTCNAEAESSCEL